VPALKLRRKEEAKGIAEAKLPQLVVVNRPLVGVACEVTRCGPSGVRTADVYLSFDEGQTWEKSQPDEPLTVSGGDPEHLPFRAKVMVRIPKDEVSCGIFVVVKNRAGVGIAPPNRGTIPQMRVELDTKAPEALLNPPRPDGDN